MLLIWSLAEVIRYPFYICKLLNIKFEVIEWLRYNAFLVLYPIGFAAEMRCWFGLIRFINVGDNENDTQINYKYLGISLKRWSMLTFALTPIVGSYMYYGMLLARNKYIRKRKKSKKRD